MWVDRIRCHHFEFPMIDSITNSNCKDVHVTVFEQFDWLFQLVWTSCCHTISQDEKDLVSRNLCALNAIFCCQSFNLHRGGGRGVQGADGWGQRVKGLDAAMQACQSFNTLVTPGLAPILNSWEWARLSALSVYVHPPKKITLCWNYNSGHIQREGYRQRGYRRLSTTIRASNGWSASWGLILG